MSRSEAGRKRFTKIALLVLFIGGLGLFFALGGHRYVSFEAIKESRDALLAYSERHFALVLAAAVSIYILSTAFSLPIATLLSLAVGLMFGRWLGTAIIVVSGTIGATLLLLAARYVFTDFLQRRASRHLEKFDQGFRRSAFLYVAFLRVVPVFPFWLVNLAAASTRIRVSTYVAATATGMIPISFVWASLGESLERIDSPQDAISGTTLIALTLIGVLGLGAIFLKNRIAQKKPAAARSQTRAAS